MHFSRKISFWVQLLCAWVLAGRTAGWAAVEPTLPVEEKILGVPRLHRKALRAHSMYRPPRTFLGMPLRRWLYALGKRGYHPTQIQRALERIEQRYGAKLAETTRAKKKIQLLSERQKRIEAKQKLLQHGNRLMRMGEKPMGYHPDAVARNEKTFVHYLHSKGFLDATLTTKTIFRKKKACLTYQIVPGRLYTIASSKRVVGDEAIEKILEPHAQATCLKVGNAYDYQDFVNEQARIVTLLARHGYFGFDEQYVRFTVEIDADNATLAVATHVDPPAPNETHKKTKITKVVVYLNSKQKTADCPLHTETYDGISFVSQKRTRAAKELAHKIAVRPGDWYDTSKLVATYERLYRIGIFDSVVVLPQLESDALVVHVHANLCDRLLWQMELSGECVDLNLKKLRPTLKVMPTLRRLFDGLSVAQIEGSFSLREQTTEACSMYENQARAFRIKWSNPFFMLVLPEQVHRALEAVHPRTALDVGCDFIKNPLYSKSKVNAGLHFYWRDPSKDVAYELVPIKIASIRPAVLDKPKVDALGIKLQPPSFLTTLFFSTTVKNTRSSQGSLHNPDFYNWGLHLAVEQGGFYEHLFALKKALPKNFLLYKHTKLDVAYRDGFRLTPDLLYVYQVKLGATFPYRTNPQVHPDKGYDAGGHGGVRAWESGLLGPGGYERTKPGATEGPKGNVLLLGNLELRQKWIEPLEAALFLDVGNTWNLSKQAPTATRFDPTHFYKTLAVGGGAGLRLNFYDTFVLCGDVALKLRKPSGRGVARSERVSFNLSIGYPF